MWIPKGLLWDTDGSATRWAVRSSARASVRGGHRRLLHQSARQPVTCANKRPTGRALLGRDNVTATRCEAIIDDHLMLNVLGGTNGIGVAITQAIDYLRNALA